MLAHPGSRQQAVLVEDMIEFRLQREREESLVLQGFYEASRDNVIAVTVRAKSFEDSFYFVADFLSGLGQTEGRHLVLLDLF